MDVIFSLWASVYLLFMLVLLALLPVGCMWEGGEKSHILVSPPGMACHKALTGKMEEKAAAACILLTHLPVPLPFQGGVDEGSSLEGTMQSHLASLGASEIRKLSSPGVGWTVTSCHAGGTVSKLPSCCVTLCESLDFSELALLFT